MDDKLSRRVGTFFILISLGLLILFIGSALNKDSNFSYLFFFVAALVLGFLLRPGAPRPEPTRFSGIRKVSQRARQRRTEKQNKKAPKK